MLGEFEANGEPVWVTVGEDAALKLRGGSLDPACARFVFTTVVENRENRETI